MNEIVPPTPQDHSIEEPQVLSLGNICMIDRSWTSTSQFSGCGWVWMDSLGKVQLMGTRNCIWRECALHLEVEALQWAVERMLQHSTCQSFGTDCKDLIAMIRVPHDWPNFATNLERIEILQIRSSRLSMFHERKIRFQTLWLQDCEVFLQKTLFYWLFHSDLVTQTTSSLSNRIAFRYKNKNKNKKTIHINTSNK